MRLFVLGTGGNRARTKHGHKRFGHKLSTGTGEARHGRAQYGRTWHGQPWHGRIVSERHGYPLMKINNQRDDLKVRKTKFSKKHS